MSMRQRRKEREEEEEEEGNEDVVALAEDLLSRNRHSNHLFHSIFVFLSASLLAVRLLLWVYAWLSPLSFAHQVTALLCYSPVPLSNTTLKLFLFSFLRG